MINIRKIILFLALITLGMISGGMIVNDKNAPYRVFYLSLTLCLDNEVESPGEKLEKRRQVVECVRKAYNTYNK